MECPYKKDIYFFEYKNNFAIVHIFTTDNIKKLNILFTYSVEKNFDQELFELIINWSLIKHFDFQGNIYFFEVKTLKFSHKNISK